MDDVRYLVQGTSLADGDILRLLKADHAADQPAKCWKMLKFLSFETVDKN